MTDSPASSGRFDTPAAPVVTPAAGRVTERPLDVLVFYSPVEATERVLAALFAAGAGRVGDYSECAWLVEGTGQFRPGAGASPAVGVVGALERLPEHRVEVTFERGLRSQVVAALRASHPYEEPAFHVIETAGLDPE